MNPALQMITTVVCRMQAGQCADFEGRTIDEAFPHPPRKTRAQIEEEIERLLLCERLAGVPCPAEPEPPTQQEQIDSWAQEQWLFATLDRLTGMLHVRKRQKACGRCGRPMVPAKMEGRVRHAAMRAPEVLSGEMKACDAVFVTEIVDALHCPECGVFEPLKD